MNNTQKQILNLIKTSLHPEKKQGEIMVEDYDTLLQELTDQSIVGIPGEYIVKSESTPEDAKKRWTHIVYSQVAEWTKLMEAQTKLINLLQENDIPLAIIKGSAAAMNYPRPEYRSMGDVDFFVRTKDFDKAYELLKANGYEFATKSKGQIHLENNKYHHVELKKNDIIFELHRRMSDTVQGKDTDQKIEALIQEGMDNIQTGKVGTYKFPMFEEKLNGLIILRHIIQHLSENKGIGLRHIIDWMQFVEKHVDDDAWQNTYAKYFDAVHLKEAAIVFARMGQIYLGLDPSIAWCKGYTPANTLREAAEHTQTETDKLAKAWMEQILASGNFGAKQTKEDEGAGVLYKNKNVFSMIKSLQSLGVSNWEPARKHKALRPFAWAYQTGRYARKGLGRKNPIKSLKQDREKSNYKKGLLKGLKID
ncbi:MAG: nucleotidyltransferase family protein [Eubacterium sp.]|nr:nucleotidyltransferase family protein [Eubacterium sp.]